MKKKKLTELQRHFKKSGQKGGKALFSKVGSEGMRDLVMKRWAKKKK